jgi:hypothetical protein
MKLTYFLDHPQIKREESFGNGNSPSSSVTSTVASAIKLGNTQTTAQKASGAPAPKGSTGGTGNMKTNIGQLLKR